MQSGSGFQNSGFSWQVKFFSLKETHSEVIFQGRKPPRSGWIGLMKSCSSPHQALVGRLHLLFGVEIVEGALQPLRVGYQPRV